MSLDLSFLQKLPMDKAIKAYEDLIESSIKQGQYKFMLRELCKQDRFFLLVYMLRRKDAINLWLYDRCREVEANPDNHLDLWSRFHYKSTFITFAGIIQEIINDPEITIVILSYNNATASDFLAQIKRELESNDDLINAFDDIFWVNPRKEAGTWSMDKGLIVKRKSNPKEPTLSAYGLVDNQPTSKHFVLRVYDDVVTRESVTTPDMISKVNQNWELSLNLGKGRPGPGGNRQQYCGTRYNANDTYQYIIGKKLLTERFYPATDDGTPDGHPVFMSEDEWEELKRSTSEYVLACQQLQNPMAGSQQEFKPEWIRRYELRPEHLNVYILVDAASSRKSTACNTAMPVIGVDAAYNRYLLDGACHKMDLNERWNTLKNLRRKWLKQPGVQSVQVGYERYGLRSDIEHFETMMKIENSYFEIVELNWPRDNTKSKDDRIRRLVPDHKNWRFFYPELKKFTKRMKDAMDKGKGYLVAKPIKNINSDGKVYELTDWFLRNEYPFFPHSQVKDMLDAMSRIYDMDVVPPMVVSDDNLYIEDFTNIRPSSYQGMLMEPDVV